MKLLYKPLGLVVGVVGGVLAGALFKRLWRAVRHEDNPPDATTAGRSWAEVLGAAALEGAVYAVVKASLERAGAIGFERATGVWPGRRDAGIAQAGD